MHNKLHETNNTEQQLSRRGAEKEGQYEQQTTQDKKDEQETVKPKEEEQEILKPNKEKQEEDNQQKEEVQEAQKEDAKKEAKEEEDVQQRRDGENNSLSKICAYGGLLVSVIKHCISFQLLPCLFHSSMHRQSKPRSAFISSSPLTLSQPSLVLPLSSYMVFLVHGPGRIATIAKHLFCLPTF